MKYIQVLNYLRSTLWALDDDKMLAAFYAQASYYSKQGAYAAAGGATADQSTRSPPSRGRTSGGANDPDSAARRNSTSARATAADGLGRMAKSLSRASIGTVDTERSWINAGLGADERSSATN